MTDSKHTPGPWLFDEAGIYTEAGASITTISKKCSDADLALIAAAPELLAALERSLNWLSSYSGGLALGCYDQAREAIAKATIPK
jgi:hypothetical protein